MTAQNLGRLTDSQLTQVLRLARAATDTDGVAPLSEQVLLAARNRHPQNEAGSASRFPHFLAYAGTHLAGYAHLEHGMAGVAATAEVVVHPSSRRRGLGTSLIQALEHAVAPSAGRGGTLQLWSHGDLDGARALALHAGYSPQRELWQMRRSLRHDVAPLPAVGLPQGFSTRHFVIGQDEEAWLLVNARAFVDHPEQGRISREDLDQRVAEPWFDAPGFILVEDLRRQQPVLAAAHWTKVLPGDATSRPMVHPTRGEVYVVGVDPAYQGLGLGRTVTVLGLAHLRDRGLAEAMLYVDAENRGALATYSRLDFVRSAVDIMYSRIVHRPM